MMVFGSIRKLQDLIDRIDELVGNTNRISSKPDYDILKSTKNQYSEVIQIRHYRYYLDSYQIFDDGEYLLVLSLVNSEFHRKACWKISSGILSMLILYEIFYVD